MLIPYMIEYILFILPRAAPDALAEPTVPPAIYLSRKLLITTMTHPRLPTDLEGISRNDTGRGEHSRQPLDGVCLPTRFDACALDLLDSERRSLAPVMFLVLTCQRGRRGTCDSLLRSLIGIHGWDTGIGGNCLGLRRRRCVLGGQSDEPKVEYADPAGRICSRCADAQRVE